MENLNKKYITFNGKLVIVGFGSIGQGVMPLILRHIEMPKENITIVTADERGHDEANELGIAFIIDPLTRENYKKILEPMLNAGDFLLNLSVDVSSFSLIELCHDRGVLYLDAGIEPWAGGYVDPSLSSSDRSNYALRESVLELRKKEDGKNTPTAIICHGANPGLISYFVKEALMNIARDTEYETDIPKTRSEWGVLARNLGIKAIHVAERDTQESSIPKSMDEFVNTWSIDGFYSEACCQPAEMGWGTHEKELPPDGARHDFGGAALFISIRKVIKHKFEVGRLFPVRTLETLLHTMNRSRSLIILPRMKVGNFIVRQSFMLTTLAMMR